MLLIGTMVITFITLDNLELRLGLNMTLHAYISIQKQNRILHPLMPCNKTGRRLYSTAHLSGMMYTSNPFVEVCVSSVRSGTEIGLPSLFDSAIVGLSH